MKQALGLVFACASAASACVAFAAPVMAAQTESWPPVDPRADVFVHFGEEHINDADGATILPKIVRQSSKFHPDLVTMSGDKANDGKPEQFQLWADVMKIYDAKGVPWLAGVGNHDRKARPGFPGGVDIQGDFAPYADFFADRPYPMGDAAGYPQISPGRREPSDPSGAASHYFADSGNARWVFIDNSCFSIILCNGVQNPSGQSPDGEEQLDFLERVGKEASAQGKLVFVVMHMPTRDPGDQTYRDPSATFHTMGKSVPGAADNELFEQAAVAAEADGVFVGHIKGQFLYRGAGDIPYFIDGGAGGELYTTGPVGTDHGYWHGFRVLQVKGDSFATDAVPIFVKNGIELAGPTMVQRGETQTFAAFGHQPVFNDPAQVPMLELRDPDPVPPAGSSAAARWLRDAVPWLTPFALLALMLMLSRYTAAEPRRRRLLGPAAIAVVGLFGFAAVSAAQQSEPTSTPVEALPNPARMWTSSKPQVLAPVESATDDRRRNVAKQTADGGFRGACPGRSKLTITSGFESTSKAILVPSAPGRIVRSIRGGRERVGIGRRTRLAAVALAQPARVVAVVRQNGNLVRRLESSCRGARRIAIRWDGKLGARRSGKAAKPGTYNVRVKVLSDRKPKKKRFEVELTRR